MTITRVVRDDVEFFTIDRTGESGMSEAGLARLCGVDRKSVSNRIRNIGATKNQNFDSEGSLNRYSRVRPKGLTPDERSYISHFAFISASVCADVIEYFVWTPNIKPKKPFLPIGSSQKWESMPGFRR